MAKPAKPPIDQEVVLSDTLECLYSLLRSIETHGDDEHGSTIADIARVSTAIIQACAERRQQQRDRRRSLSSYDVGELVAFINSMSDRDREAIGQGISGEDPADVPLFGVAQ